MAARQAVFTACNEVVLNCKNFPDPAFRAYLCQKFQCAPGDALAVSALRHTTVLNVTGLGIESLTGLGYFPFLTELWCGQNRLTRLDTSCCPALKTLVCEYNQLEHLDVRGNPALEELVCGANLLARLDLRGNPCLTELLCENNLLLGLNLTENPQLHQLWCACNRIRRINLRANPHLRDLHVDSPSPVRAATPSHNS